MDVDAGVGVICDDAGVEAMAGIMGGDATAVSLDTRNVYVEAAFWWPDSIRGRSRRYNFSTDAAHRFERGVDFATTVDHIEYITRLILDICGGQPGPVDDTVLALPERTPVTMRVERCRRVLGIPIEANDMADAFRRLGLAFEAHADRFVVTPPSYRFDLEIEEDLIEEVARLFGFERIPADPPRAAAQMRMRREEQRSMHDVRRALARDGYQELVNYSFVDAAWEQDFAGNPDPIRVLNPIASQMSVMRSTLLGGLVASLGYNLNRKQNRARLFEVGRVFLRDPEVPDGPLAVQGIAQPTVVSGLAYGPAEDEQWGVATRDVDFYDVKGDIERLFAPVPVRFVRAEHPALHPGRSAFVEVNGATVGFVGELHPQAAAEVRVAEGGHGLRSGSGAAAGAPVAPLQPRLEVPAGDARHLDHRRRRASGRGDRGGGGGPVECGRPPVGAPGISPVRRVSSPKRFKQSRRSEC